MDLKLKGKKALVTGSTSGIGYAIAQSLLQEGASIIINGRTEERVLSAVDKLNKYNIHKQIVVGIAADVGTKEGVNKVINQVQEIDILINNYGVYAARDFEEITDEEWLEIFNQNVMSGIRLSRH